MARKKSSDSTVILEDSIGIEQAESIKKKFTDSINSNKTTLVDLAKVTDIDTSIIQLIFSANNEATAQKKEFFVINIPDDIKNLLSIMSLSLPEKVSEEKVEEQ